MVDCAEDYPWSSAAAHCGLGEDLLLSAEWVTADRIQNWGPWLKGTNESEIDQRIREWTFTGRPCGDESFVQEAERLLGRPVAPKKPGPKPKQFSAEKDSILWTDDEIPF